MGVIESASISLIKKRVVIHQTKEEKRLSATGNLIDTAKETQYLSAYKMNQVNSATPLPREENLFTPTNSMGENSEKSGKKFEKRKADQEDSTPAKMSSSSKKSKTSHREANVGVDPKKKLDRRPNIADIGLLPVGEEMNIVGRVIVSSEDVGNALQFSEFCSVFGKILNLNKTRAEHVLQDIFHGRMGRRGKISATVLFHIDMLSVIKNEQGEDCKRPPASGENSWFNILKECVCESQSVLKAHGLDFLDDVDDYETLDPSQKLKLLNVLCDEILSTKRVRNWIDKQNDEVVVRYKEAKENLSAAIQEEKNLKQKIKDEVAEAIIAKNGASLSVPENEVIHSRFKSERAKAQEKVLDSTVILEKNKKQHDAVRLDPIFQTHGYSYWKPNASGKNDILCQIIGTGDNTLTLDEKWSAINVEEKEVIEKHISAAASCSSASSSRRKRLKAPKV